MEQGGRCDSRRSGRSHGDGRLGSRKPHHLALPLLVHRLGFARVLRPRLLQHLRRSLPPLPVLVRMLQRVFRLDDCRAGRAINHDLQLREFPTAVVRGFVVSDPHQRARLSLLLRGLNQFDHASRKRHIEDRLPGHRRGALRCWPAHLVTRLRVLPELRALARRGPWRILDSERRPVGHRRSARRQHQREAPIHEDQVLRPQQHRDFEDRLHLHRLRDVLHLCPQRDHIIRIVLQSLPILDR
mmetsp:Transcript_118784/g.378883  ORF Transcript_118784/g.378883 Transcript_118784/m.378883 type:complete len:242 (-) Transcript_118784:374-1099(-)